MAEHDVQELERKRIAEIRDYQNELRDELDAAKETGDPRAGDPRWGAGYRQRRERGIRAINKKYAKRGGYKL